MSTIEPYVHAGYNLRFERSILAGGFIATFGYGIFLCVSSATMYMMLSNFSAGRPPSKLVLSYTLLLFCGATVFTATNWRWSELLLVSQRDFPGGPPNAFYELFSDVSNTISNIALFCNTALVESLLLWRLYIIWNAKKWVMVVPCLWFIATTGLAIMTVVRSAQPGVDPRVAIEYAVPFFISSVLLNLTLTALIASRLLYLRRSLTSAPSSTTYFSLASLLVESSLLQSLLGVGVCVTLAIDTPTGNVMVILLGEVVCINPMLILMRVAWGSGFQHTRSMRWQSGQGFAPASSNGADRTEQGHFHVVSPSLSRPSPTALRKGFLGEPSGSHVEEIHLSATMRRDDHNISYLPSV